MKLTHRRVSALAAVALVGSLVMTGCGSNSASDSSSGSGDTTVTFLPKNLGNPYFDTSDAGGKKAVQEFGGTFDEVGPDPDDPVTVADAPCSEPSVTW